MKPSVRLLVKRAKQIHFDLIKDGLRSLVHCIVLCGHSSTGGLLVELRYFEVIQFVWVRELV